MPTTLTNASKPGVLLRSFREKRSLTLRQVSVLTGLPVSSLSKLENGKMSLSFDKLTRIAKGLQIDLGVLFGALPSAGPDGAPQAAGRRSLTRAGEGQLIDTLNYRHVYPATDLLNKRMTPIVAEIRAKTLKEFGKMIRHTGEEYVYVLEGEVELHSELYAPVRLRVGDSIYFDSSMGHAYLAACDGPCRVLSVCSPDPAELHAAIEP